MRHKKKEKEKEDEGCNSWSFCYKVVRNESQDPPRPGDLRRQILEPGIAVGQ